MKDKIQGILNTIKEKISSNKKLSKLLDSITDKIYNLKETDPTKKALRRRSLRKLKQIFSLKNISIVIAIMVSVPAVVFFVYTASDYMQAKRAEKASIDYKVINNLNYATKYILHQLQYRNIKKKNVRRLIKVLNRIDDFGRMHNFSPCEGGYLAYGETPNPGNVTIEKIPNPYGFQLTAYNCNMDPLASKLIKLKRPPRKKKHKKIDHSEPANNGHKTHATGEKVSKGNNNDQQKEQTKQDTHEEHKADDQQKEHPKQDAHEEHKADEQQKEHIKQDTHEEHKADEQQKGNLSTSQHDETKEDSSKTGHH